MCCVAMESRCFRSRMFHVGHVTVDRAAGRKHERWRMRLLEFKIINACWPMPISDRPNVKVYNELYGSPEHVTPFRQVMSFIF